MPNTFAAMEYLDKTTGTELDGDTKGKVHPRTNHEGPEVEYIYNSTLSLTLCCMGWVAKATPHRLTPGKDPVSIV